MTAAEIEDAVSGVGLEPLAAGIADKFQIYLDLLQKWNARLNLTAIRDPEKILQRHFIECIFAAQHLPGQIQSLLDFGSGGGFPGIPIALCLPEIHVTLGESQSKKATFLREAIRTLGLENAEVYNGRVERLRGYFVLFVTEDTSLALVSEFDQIDWASPVLLPGSSQRLLLIGRSSIDVPRGTSIP
jgi:16S rRNA (guanine527-N7)-methyltransferase